MAEIIFQTSAGDKFIATLSGDTLSDIRPFSQPSSPPSAPGSRPPQEQSQEQPPEPQEGSAEPLKPADRIFVEQLKAVLVNNRARKQLRHKQKGILDSRKLVQTQLDSTAVWRQHNRKDSQRNYSVLLLVDESGSMSRDGKAELAQDVTQEVAASLGLVDGVETAVIGFAGNRLVERKRFDNSGLNSLDSIVESVFGRSRTASARRINAVQETDQENADLIAIEYSLDYLRKQASPKSRLVFVMLSDGAPCPSPSDITVVTADMTAKTFHSQVAGRVADTESITAMHALVRKASDISSFGLGMLKGGQQIPKHKVVKDVTDTRKELIAFLRSALQ